MLKHFFGNRKQFVIVFNDGAYLCTCMLLSHAGIICRHFLVVLRASQIAKFHISMIPKRWNKESIDNDKLKKETLLTSNVTGIKQQSQKNSELFDSDLIKEIT